MSFAGTAGINDRQAGGRDAGTGRGQMDPLEATDGTREAAAAIRAGDQSAFTALAERHRRELLVHCYRMLGSFDDAEDALQDTFLRAWRYRESLKDGASLRPWLYRVATNACLDAIARDPDRSALARIADEAGGRASLGPAEVTWLQPFPDRLLEPAARRESEPEGRVLTQEAIALAFLTVIQLLTPQQRAALILRDVLDWSAKEAADLLGTSVAAANSALQRARATLRAHLPSRKPEWPPGVAASAAERELLRKYVDAAERQDLAALESLIREDAVFRMPPDPLITTGREAILRLWSDRGFGSERFGRVRCATTRANRQPAVAYYVLRDGEPAYRALTLVVLRIEEGRIAEVVNFVPEVFEAFGLPPTLESPLE
jgi:RNA polymerase sigma-70 factor (ECF subfamily)